ncbi:hypothetical protein AB0U34_22755 [Escherichia coli]
MAHFVEHMMFNGSVNILYRHLFQQLLLLSPCCRIVILNKTIYNSVR